MIGGGAEIESGVTTTKWGKRWRWSDQNEGTLFILKAVSGLSYGVFWDQQS